MQKDYFEEDSKAQGNTFLNLLENQDLEDIFILSEILNSTKFDQ